MCVKHQPSKRIVYGAHEAPVCFLSDEVDRCMKGFKEEWEGVSKVIAHEGMPASGGRTCGCSRLTYKPSSSPTHWYVSRHSHLID